MPLYEYRGQKCGHVFELLRRMQEADKDLECPACHSKKVERQLSTFAAGGCSSSSRGFT